MQYEYRPTLPERPRLAERLLVAVLFLAVGVFLWRNLIRPEWTAAFPVRPAPVEPRGDLASDEQDTIRLFKPASPSVVHMTTQALRRDFYSRDIFQIAQGEGIHRMTHLFDRDFRRACPDRHQQLNGYQPSPKNVLF